MHGKIGLSQLTRVQNLYYLYKKSTKKLKELKALYEILSEMYEFSNNCIKPHHATETCWIDHKMKAMEGMLDKYGVYQGIIQEFNLGVSSHVTITS